MVQDISILQVRDKFCSSPVIYTGPTILLPVIAGVCWHRLAYS